MPTDDIIDTTVAANTTTKKGSATDEANGAAEEPDVRVMGARTHEKAAHAIHSKRLHLQYAQC